MWVNFMYELLLIVLCFIFYFILKFVLLGYSKRKVVNYIGIKLLFVVI